MIDWNASKVSKKNTIDLRKLFKEKKCSECLMMSVTNRDPCGLETFRTLVANELKKNQPNLELKGWAQFKSVQIQTLTLCYLLKCLL